MLLLTDMVLKLLLSSFWIRIAPKGLKCTYADQVNQNFFRVGHAPEPPRLRTAMLIVVYSHVYVSEQIGPTRTV